MNYRGLIVLRYCKLPTALLLMFFLLVSACSSLHIDPPGPDRQTLLVLPARVSNPTGAEHGYSYSYEIRRVDNSVPPYEVSFELPLQGDMLILDYLPPGDYYVSKLVSNPVNIGNLSVGYYAEDRSDGFRLKAGGITIFSKSLDVRIAEPVDNGAAGGKINYARRMVSVTPSHKSELLETLAKFKNFDEWNYTDND
jgi:hypothetical protein